MIEKYKEILRFSKFSVVNAPLLRLTNNHFN